MPVTKRFKMRYNQVPTDRDAHQRVMESSNKKEETQIDVFSEDDDGVKKGEEREMTKQNEKRDDFNKPKKVDRKRKNGFSWLGYFITFASFVVVS